MRLACTVYLTRSATYTGDVENLLPAAVDSQDSYDRFVTIMRRINQYLFPAFMPDVIPAGHALICRAMA